MKKNSNLNDVANMLAEQIDGILQEKSRVIVAIDGRCASGKTTLASVLREKLSCEVIHMDDFFLPPEKRTEERLHTPGGNVDYERFAEEVMKPLKAGQSFVYCPFDCRTQSLKEPVGVGCSRVIIIEGAYACHPTLWGNYDLHVFLDVDAKLQMERILARNGAAGAERFAQKWIPLEEAYFAAYGIKERCEVTVPK